MMPSDRCAFPKSPKTSRAPRRILLALLVVGALIVALPPAQATHTTEEGLAGEGCAVTPGGWGATPNGHNPGALLHAWFDDVFGDELVVGDLTFEDAQDVTDALPYGGGFDGSFQSHAVALAINIAFGDAGLLNGTVSDIEVEGGDYDGFTAVELLAEAEDVLLNDPTITGAEYSALNTAMSEFNDEDLETHHGCHEVPDCPEDLMAVAQSDGTVLITWDEVEDAEAYGVYRATGESEDFVLLDTTTDTEYNDTTTAVGVTYHYIVTAWDGLLESEGCASVTTTAIPFFPGLVLGGLAVAGSVGAYRWLRRP